MWLDSACFQKIFVPADVLLLFISRSEFSCSHPVVVSAQEASMPTRTGPDYKLTFVPEATPAKWKVEGEGAAAMPKVCVLRQEGSNGDREMLSAFHEAGLQAWDVNMNDLLAGTVSTVCVSSCLYMCV